MLMVMPMILVMRPRHKMQQSLGKLPHIRRIAPHRDNQTALLPPLMRCENRRLKQVLSRRRTAVNNVRTTDLLLLQPFEIVKRGGQDAELGVRPSFSLFGRGGHEGELSQDLASTVGETSVDNVDVLDGAAAHEESESHMPVGLAAAAEHGQGPDMVATAEEASGCESGAEGCQGTGVDEARGTSIGGEESQYAGRTDGFYGRILGYGG